VWVNCAQTLLQIVYWWHPLLWIANARIRRLREEAVDDAVMLALREESDSYAPTLLEVARLALRRPLLSLGLVGILESRGALRQRIERLVEFRAPRKAGLTFASLCGIFAFSAVALPMGEAPAPAPAEQQVEVKLAASALPAVRESTNRVPVLVEAQFYEMPPGDFKDLVSGLQFKPGVKNEDSCWSASKENFSTLQTTLTKVGFHLLARPRVQTRSGMPAELYCGNGTNGVWFNCMPTVEGNIVDLSVDGKVINGWQQVVSTNQFRATASAENDGGIVIRIDRMDGLETSNLVVVIGVELITNTPPVHLQQRLQAVIKRVDVANSLAAAGSTNQLFVRTFKVDTRAFIAGLKQVGAAFGEETNPPAPIAMAVRKFIGGLGVNWDLPAGKSCFFNDRNGLLFVRATESDLDLVERAVQILDYMEPQIHIKARFLEVPMGTVANFGSLLVLTNSTVNQFTGILNSTNTTAALIALQSRSGSELLAEPEGTTVSGRQMQMRATQLISVVNNFEFQEGRTNGPDAIVPQVSQIETGPVLDVIPHVLSDGYTINLTVIPSVTEFLGYANPPDVPNVTGTNNRVQLPVILPQFSKREMTANLNLWDGQTVLIGGMAKANHFVHKVPVLGSVPLIGRMFRTENDTTNEILVLITATIVDPSGKRVHADTEMPFAAAAVPPQPSP
jgi:Flp pilus assembly secretin CpaC